MWTRSTTNSTVSGMRLGCSHHQCESLGPCGTAFSLRRPELAALPARGPEPKPLGSRLPRAAGLRRAEGSSPSGGRGGGGEWQHGAASYGLQGTARPSGARQDGRRNRWASSERAPSCAPPTAARVRDLEGCQDGGLWGRRAGSLLADFAKCDYDETECLAKAKRVGAACLYVFLLAVCTFLCLRSLPSHVAELWDEPSLWPSRARIQQFRVHHVLCFIYGLSPSTALAGGGLSLGTVGFSDPLLCAKCWMQPVALFVGVGAARALWQAAVQARVCEQLGRVGDLRGLRRERFRVREEQRLEEHLAESSREHLAVHPRCASGLSSVASCSRCTHTHTFPRGRRRQGMGDASPAARRSPRHACLQSCACVFHLLAPAKNRTAPGTRRTESPRSALPASASSRTFAQPGSPFSPRLSGT